MAWDTYWLRIDHLRLTKLPWTIELLNIAVQTFTDANIYLH